MTFLIELLVLAVFALLVVYPVVQRCSPRWRWTWLLATPGLVFGLGFAYSSWLVPGPDALASVFVPRRSHDQGFVSSETCRSCHPGQFNSWHRSYHRTMTQVASPTSIVDGASRDFTGRIQLAGHGQTAGLRREGNEFWVNMVNPEWDLLRASGDPEANALREPPREDRRVLMTTGSHHFQVFWVNSRRSGELWQFPWRYHIAEDRWIHRNDAFLQPADKPATSHFRTWNRDCIHCHNVGGEPGIGPPPQLAFSETRVGEIGIACEACHGPGQKHVRHYRDPLKRYGHLLSGNPDSTLINPAKVTGKTGSQVCGQCHSHLTTHAGDSQASREFLRTGLAYRAGDDLDRFVRFLKLGDGYAGNEHRFWSDGTCRSGGREYNSLLASPCYQPQAQNQARSMSCFSCHSMHTADPDDQLSPQATDNRACLQCHSKYSDERALAAHTHHELNSSGSQCYNCHMPHTSYALFKAIRSHQIDSPRVTPTGPNSRPNACNLCHLDRTLQWTAEHLTSWHQHPPVTLGETDRKVAASLNWLLAGDAAQRAITAWHFGWKPALEEAGTDWIPLRIAPALDDPYPAVRFITWQSLKSLPGLAPFSYEFDGATRERQESIQAIGRSWRPPRKITAPELLSTEDGTLDQVRLQQLQESRDNRGVEIYE